MAAEIINPHYYLPVPSVTPTWASPEALFKDQASKIAGRTSKEDHGPIQGISDRKSVMMRHNDVEGARDCREE